MTRQAVYQQQRRARGVCVSCPAPSVRFARCAACRATANARDLARYRALDPWARYERLEREREAIAERRAHGA